MTNEERVKRTQEEIQAVFNRYGSTLMVLGMDREVFQGQTLFVPRWGVVLDNSWKPSEEESTHKEK